MVDKTTPPGNDTKVSDTNGGAAEETSAAMKQRIGVRSLNVDKDSVTLRFVDTVAKSINKAAETMFKQNTTITKEVSKEQKLMFTAFLQDLRTVSKQGDDALAQKHTLFLNRLSSLEASFLESLEKNPNDINAQELISAVRDMKRALPNKKSKIGTLSDLFSMPKPEDWKQGSFMREILSTRSYREKKALEDARRGRKAGEIIDTGPDVELELERVDGKYAGDKKKRGGGASRRGSKAPEGATESGPIVQATRGFKASELENLPSDTQKLHNDIINGLQNGLKESKKDAKIWAKWAIDNGATDIAGAIKQVMLEKGKRREEKEKELGVSNTTVNRKEDGSINPPTTEAKPAPRPAPAPIVPKPAPAPVKEPEPVVMTIRDQIAKMESDLEWMTTKAKKGQPGWRDSIAELTGRRDELKIQLAKEKAEKRKGKRPQDKKGKFLSNDAWDELIEKKEKRSAAAKARRAAAQKEKGGLAGPATFNPAAAIEPPTVPVAKLVPTDELDAAEKETAERKLAEKKKQEIDTQTRKEEYDKLRGSTSTPIEPKHAPHVADHTEKPEVIAPVLTPSIHPTEPSTESSTPGEPGIQSDKDKVEDLLTDIRDQLKDDSEKEDKKDIDNKAAGKGSMLDSIKSGVKGIGMRSILGTTAVVGAGALAAYGINKEGNEALAAQDSQEDSKSHEYYEKMATEAHLGKRKLSPAMKQALERKKKEGSLQAEYRTKDEITASRIQSKNLLKAPVITTATNNAHVHTPPIIVPAPHVTVTPPDTNASTDSSVPGGVRPQSNVFSGWVKDRWSRV